MSEHLLRGLFALLAWLPLPVQYVLGELLGSLVALIPNRHRRVSLRNLQLCFPELSEYQRIRLMIHSLRETARTILETPLIWRASRQRLDHLIRQVHGEELLDQALAAGKGVIMASPHLGSWELSGQYLQGKAPLTGLFKPPEQPAIQRLMVEGRAHLGIEMVPTDAQGVRRLFASLKRGGMIGILPDQDPGEGGGVFAPYFGIPTLTMSLLPKLAARSQAPVLVIYTERLSWGRGYAVHILPCDPAVSSEDPLCSATALNAAVEAAVRQCPGQYQWSYKRFRSRPPGEPSRYKGPYQPLGKGDRTN